MAIFTSDFYIHIQKSLGLPEPYLKANPVELRRWQKERRELLVNLEINHKTVQAWIKLLENIYYCYRIYPFQSKKINALKKEAKLYLWDWSEVPNEPARLENLVASHLLKYCHYLEDALGYKASLHYLREINQKEVDFLVSIDNKPYLAVEVSMKAKSEHALNYFKEKLSIPHVYQIFLEDQKGYRDKHQIHYSNIADFLLGFV
jgi:predicted AAA+ superfamily ATPase